MEAVRNILFLRLTAQNSARTEAGGDREGGGLRGRMAHTTYSSFISWEKSFFSNSCMEILLLLGLA